MLRNPIFLVFVSAFALGLGFGVVGADPGGSVDESALAQAARPADVQDTIDAVELPDRPPTIDQSTWDRLRETAIQNGDPGLLHKLQAISAQDPYVRAAGLGNDASEDDAGATEDPDQEGEQAGDRWVEDPARHGKLRLDTIDSPEELAALDTFQDQLDVYMVDLEAMLVRFPEDVVMDYVEHVEAARQAVGELSPEQLAVLRDAFTEYDGFWNTPDEIVSIMDRHGGGFLEGGLGAEEHPVAPDLLPGVVPTAPAVSIPQRQNCKDFGGKGTCNECPAPPAGGLITLSVLKSAELAACAACDFIDADFFVASVEVPNPIKLICLAIKEGLQFARLGVEAAREVNLECQQNYHRALTHALLDVEVSTRASQVSFDHFSAFSIRLAIEEDMLREADDRISLFQLPASQGGFLDRTDRLSVRYIVQDTIEMQRDLGNYDVRNAEDEYAAAEAHYAAGEYQSAYARYRLAYRAAVRVGRVPGP